jgi:hypothetical protein
MDTIVTPPQAEINRDMARWGDAEFRRFAFRVGLFQRRGLSPADSERVADYLALRDQRKDDRRLCLECSNLQQTGACFAAARGWMQAERIGKTLHALPMLQRCGAFEWVKP